LSYSHHEPQNPSSSGEFKLVGTEMRVKQTAD